MRTFLVIAALSLSGCTAADMAAFNAGYYGTGLQRPVYQRPQQVIIFDQPAYQPRPLPSFKVNTKIVDTPYGTVNCTDTGGSVTCY